MYEDFKKRSAIPHEGYLERFDTHLADDLDTPGAIAVLWEMMKDTSVEDSVKCGTLMAMDDILDIGLSEEPAEGARLLGVVSKNDIPDDIQELIDKREIARIARNWTEADFLREALAQKGYIVEDTAQGVRVTRQ
jgi:cysteinyl-tRNA synthetase